MAEEEQIKTESADEEIQKKKMEQLEIDRYVICNMVMQHLVERWFI